LILAIGCIHGDECAGVEAVARPAGCPPPGGGIVRVPNLNPDGLALGSRLNANGVDLNRNFAERWRPIGEPGDPEHSGPHPFSEPETRLARRLIRVLRPDVTIWFHQQDERLVRAWGPSVPAARAYARLAGEPFVRLPWMDGTAPHWQNERFPGTSSFVVELPASGPVDVDRHATAIFRLAAELARGDDG
jgi:protein MpaA